MSWHWPQEVLREILLLAGLKTCILLGQETMARELYQQEEWSIDRAVVKGGLVEAKWIAKHYVKKPSLQSVESAIATGQCEMVKWCLTNSFNRTNFTFLAEETDEDEDANADIGFSPFLTPMPMPMPMPMPITAIQIKICTRKAFAIAAWYRQFDMLDLLRGLLDDQYNRQIHCQCSCLRGDLCRSILGIDFHSFTMARN